MMMKLLLEMTNIAQHVDVDVENVVDQKYKNSDNHKNIDLDMIIAGVDPSNFVEDYNKNLMRYYLNSSLCLNQLFGWSQNFHQNSNFVDFHRKVESSL